MAYQQALLHSGICLEKVAGLRLARGWSIQKSFKVDISKPSCHTEIDGTVVSLALAFLNFGVLPMFPSLHHRLLHREVGGKLKYDVLNFKVYNHSEVGIQACM